MGDVLLVLMLLPVVFGVPLALLIVLVGAWRRTTLLLKRTGLLEEEVVALRAELRRLQADPSAMAGTPSEPETVPVALAGGASASVDEPVPAVSAPAVSAPDASVPAASPAEGPPSKPVPATRPPITPERLAMWLAAGLGGLSVVLASLFALSAAIDRGWVGPAARVGLGLGLSMAAWWGGTIARGRGLRWVGSALVGAGIAGLCGTLYASNVLFGLLSTPVTFGLLALVSVVALASGVRQGSRFDAWLGLFGGLATPVLVEATEPRPLVLFGYLALLVAATVLAAARRGWPELIVGAALGFSALFVGWTLEGARPIDQPVALGVVGLLGVVFAGAVRWTGPDPRIQRVLGVVGALLPLLAGAWLMPPDPLFSDPFSGLTVFRPSPHGPWLAAAGLPLVLLAPVVGGRHLWSRRLVSLVAVALAVVFVVGHREAPAPSWWALALGLGSLPLLGLRFRPDPEDPAASTVWLLPMATGAGAALGLSLLQPAPAGVLLMGLVGTLPGTVVALTRRSRRLFLPALLGAAIPLNAAAMLVPEVGPAPVAGPAALAFGLFGTLPLLLRGADARSSVAAALAGPACFLPLYRAWEAAGGVHLIGVLPALMGAVALLGALTLIRQHGVRRDSGPLALFVGVTLLGLTAAIPLQLRDQWVTVAWALEGVALAAVSRRLDHRLLRVSAVLLGLAVTVRLVLNPWALEYADSGGLPILNWTLYTWGVPAVCLLASARYLGADAKGRPRVPAWARLLLVLCSLVVGFALVNVQVSHAFQDSGPIELGGRGIWQGMVRSLAWAGYGIAILAAGTLRDHRVIRMVGFVVVLGAAGKVFLSDLWSLSGFVRVGSIAGLGVTLLVAAFVFERLVLRRASDHQGGPA